MSEYIRFIKYKCFSIFVYKNIRIKNISLKKIFFGITKCIRIKNCN